MKKPNHFTKKLHASRKSKSSALAAQHKRLLSALKEDNFSTLAARKELDIMHPAGRIRELRKKGYEIITQWQWEPTDSVKPHKVGLYILMSEKESANE